MSNDVRGRIALCANLLRALGERAPALSPDQVDHVLAGWSLVDVGGAVVMIRGAEMHVGAVPEARGRWFGRCAIELMTNVLAQHGRVETLVMNDHTAGHAFARRLGFEKVGECGAVTRYKLRKLRHANSHRPA
jgi:RimJ/RimL family protein N-acetyltransferase